MIVYIYAIYLAVVSLIAFSYYVIDKKRAQKNSKKRIPEKTLLLLTFVGGSIGSIIAMHKFRHKTKHWYFVMINYFSLTLHLFILGYLIINYL